MTDQCVSGEIIIRGVTVEGKRFRPSDWAERLAGVVSVMGADHRMHYSRYVRPIFRSGLRCVVIEKTLEQKAPAVYAFLMGFARDNRLEIVEGRDAPRD